LINAISNKNNNNNDDENDEILNFFVGLIDSRDIQYLLNHNINIFESLAQFVYIFNRVVHKRYDETLIYITYSRIEKYIPFLYVFRLCLSIDCYLYLNTISSLFKIGYESNS
jgi:hypothetical protein